MLTVQTILGHRYVDTTLRYSRLYDGTVAADYYRAMDQVERHLELQEDADRPAPGIGQLLAMVDSLQAGTLNDAQRYKDEQAVVQDAICALLAERPQLRLELAIHRYRAEEVSLAKAAAPAGVSWERMREILLSRGIQPFLGPETEAEAIQKVQAMERIAHKH